MCRKASSPSNFKVWKKKLRPLALAVMSTPGALPENGDLQYHNGPLADDSADCASEPEVAETMVESQSPVSEDDTDTRPAGWKQWWASDAHRDREQERTDRVIRISSDAYAELADALPTSCPSFEAVMHFVEWTVLNNAHGHLMSIDVHLHDRVMEEFSSCAARRGLSVRNEVGLASLLGSGR